MSYPDDIYKQRDLENLPGLVYDPQNKKTLFAEDILTLGSEIRAIEQTLGTHFEPGGGGELPVGTIHTTAKNLGEDPPFDYGNWELLASGKFYGGKLTYTYERIS